MWWVFVVEREEKDKRGKRPTTKTQRHHTHLSLPLVPSVPWLVVSFIYWDILWLQSYPPLVPPLGASLVPLGPSSLLPASLCVPWRSLGRGSWCVAKFREEGRFLARPKERTAHAHGQTRTNHHTTSLPFPPFPTVGRSLVFH